MKSMKSIKRNNRMRHNPFAWKTRGLTRSAVDQINYMRANWNKGKKLASLNFNKL